MTARLLRPLAACLALGFLVSASSLPAQAPRVQFPAPSPAASLKQTVGLTEVEIVYSRPSAKGRTVFGGLVPWGQVWRTGANAATKITFSTPVKFGGQDVPAGSYALFSIPGPDTWTVILNNVTGQWGAYTYDAKNDVVRVTVKPTTLGTPLESLTLNLHHLRDDAATLSIAWADVMVPVPLEFDVVGPVTAQLEAALASPEKKPAQFYHAAAQFSLDHGLDLARALTWVDAALAENPNAFWTMHLKAKLHAKLGQKPEAIAAARRSIELASGGPREEYTRLNEALIASLR